MSRLPIILIFLACFLATCDECEPEETKCEDNKVYLCYPDGDWEFVMNCGGIEGPYIDSIWICEEDEFGEAGCELQDGGLE